MKVFSSCHLISHVFIHFQDKQSVLRLDWSQSGVLIGILVLKMFLICASCLRWVVIEPCVSIERFPILFFFVFFSQPLFWTPNNVALSICESPPLRMPLWGIYIIPYSMAWSYIIFGAKIQIWDILANNHHWLSRQMSLKWNQQKKKWLKL